MQGRPILTLLALNNYAAFHLETGNYAEAKYLFRRCLRPGKRPPPSIQIPCRPENLVLISQAGGEAEALARSGLTARERTLGPHHPDTFGNLATLADVLRDQGDASGAELLYQEALDGLENSLGPVHPERYACFEYAFFAEEPARRSRRVGSPFS